MIRTNIIYSLIAALVVYILFSFVGYIPYMPFSTVGCTIAFAAAILVGGGASAFCITHNVQKIKSAWIRLLISLAVFLVITRILAYSGLYQIIDEHFSINQSEANMRADGLWMALYLRVVIYMSLGAIVFVAVKKATQSSKE